MIKKKVGRVEFKNKICFGPESLKVSQDIINLLLNYTDNYFQESFVRQNKTTHTC